jgi:hypothetical protein
MDAIFFSLAEMWRVKILLHSNESLTPNQMCVSSSYLDSFYNLKMSPDPNLQSDQWMGLNLPHLRSMAKIHLINLNH